MIIVLRGAELLNRPRLVQRDRQSVLLEINQTVTLGNVEGGVRTHLHGFIERLLHAIGINRFVQTYFYRRAH